MEKMSAILIILQHLLICLLHQHNLQNRKEGLYNPMV